MGLSVVVSKIVQSFRTQINTDLTDLLDLSAFICENLRPDLGFIAATSG